MTDELENDLEAVMEIVTGTIEASLPDPGVRMNLLINLAKMMLTGYVWAEDKDFDIYFRELHTECARFAGFVRRIPAYHAVELQRDMVAMGHVPCNDCALCVAAKQGEIFMKLDKIEREREEREAVGN